MTEELIPLGEQPPEVILEKLRELEGPESAERYARRLEPGRKGLEGLFGDKPWLNTQHQYGFIPRYRPGQERYHKIVSASNMPDGQALSYATLVDKRINIKLDYLRIHQYPPPLLSLGDNKHTILFNFEARNQVKEGAEAVAFNQTYEARSGQDVAVKGQPIFIGLNVGPQGVLFSCRTVNVSNSNDDSVVKAINSEAVSMGLNLLTTAQPALVPFVGVARGLWTSLAKHSQNTLVQRFTLGLDFEAGTTGAQLGIGSYVVAQVPRADEITWSEWKLDAENGTIVRADLAEGEETYSLPYNTVVFRVSPYEEPQ